MKKLMGILTVLFVVIGLSACGNSSPVAIVQPSEVTKKIEAKETFITIVSSTTCAACKAYAPIVEEFAKNNEKLPIVEVQIDKIDNQDDKTKFINSYSLSATPTTMFIKDGKVVATKESALTEVELSELFNQYLK